MLNLKRNDLALNSGSPIRTKPWLDNFTTGEEEEVAASRVLRSKYLSLFEGSHTPDAPFSFWGGPEVQKMERAWAEHYEVPFAVSMNSATSCLYAAMGALNVGYGDEVICSPYTMSASAACALVYGAIPVFADVEESSGCLDPQSIRSRITPRTKAIVLVHQFGLPADMDAIMKICQEHKLYLIEDCAQAHGAKYGNQYVGTFGDIGIFSLNVNKSIQAGEGGICVVKNEELRYRLALVRNHGEAVVGPAGYEKIEGTLGFNYRMTEIGAAIIGQQLSKLNDLNARRLEMVHDFIEHCSKFDFLKPLLGREKAFPTYYVVPIRFLEDVAKCKRTEFVEALNKEGACFYQAYVKPLYTQPIYQRRTCFKHGYPFSAPENKDSNPDYSVGSCLVAERLHYKEMIINEHIRPPHSMEDIQDLKSILTKVAG